jgi:hypothetical protein
LPILGGRVPELNLTEEEVKAIADEMGIAESDVDFTTLRGYHEMLKEKAETSDDDDGDGDDDGEGDEPSVSRSFAELVATPEGAELLQRATEGADAMDRWRAFERETLIGGAIREFKFDPSEKGDWERRYDENPVLVKEIIDGLKPDAELERTYGSEEVDEEGLAAEDAQYKAYAAQHLNFEDGEEI